MNHDQNKLHAAHARLLELARQYRSGVLCIDEYVIAVAQVGRKLPRLEGGLIDPATGLRYDSTDVDPRVDGYNPEFLGAKPPKAGEDY